MHKTNIKKLAQELNISAATVSRALRDSYEIGIDTKQRVWDLAKEWKYEPNPFASNLRQQKSKTIAVIVPEIANHFFSIAIDGIEEIARQRGYHVLIYQTHDDNQAEIAFTERLLSGRVDGVLISVSSHTDSNEHLIELNRNLPTVFFDRTFEQIDAMKITTDDYESSYKATLHLIECRCKKIVYLGGLANLDTGKKRLMGYKDALESKNFIYDEQLVINCGKEETTKYEHIKHTLLTQKPDGILSSIEELALPCYYVCKDLGIRIPEDLKIISYSNLDSAALLNPPLTTIWQPAFDIGQEAASILFKILEKKWFEPNGTRTLTSVIIERGSTLTT